MKLLISVQNFTARFESIISSSIKQCKLKNTHTLISDFLGVVGYEKSVIILLCDLLLNIADVIINY